MPDISLDSGLKQTNLPEGLIYLENFIDDTYAQQIIEFLEKHNESNEKQDLKRRRVKHFGYEFRYGTSDCDETQPLTDPGRSK